MNYSCIQWHDWISVILLSEGSQKNTSICVRKNTNTSGNYSMVASVATWMHYKEAWGIFWGVENVPYLDGGISCNIWNSTPVLFM